MKYGFYKLQSVCDWYREVTADIGMHADLVQYWIGVAALLASPIAPHFAEHIWRGILQHPTTIAAMRPDPLIPLLPAPPRLLLPTLGTQLALRLVLIELVAQPVNLLLELPKPSAPRKVRLRQLQSFHRVFVKGMYTEDEDVKEGEDTEPLR
jgi:hypothetical protein